MDGSNAPKWSKSRFADCCIYVFPSSQALQGCPRHHYKSQLANQSAVQMCVVLNLRCSRIGEQVNGIHAILSCLLIDYLIESRMLSFVIVKEDLRIETSYPFNEVTAVFLLNNSRYHHTSHSDEPLS